MASLLMLSACLLVSAQELRLGIAIERNIVPKLAVEGQAQLRTLINRPETLYSVVQAGLNFELSEIVALSSSIRYSSSPGELEEEIGEEINEKVRFTADLKLSTKRLNSDIKIRNRFRYQHSALVMDDNRDYIRNKFILDYKLAKGMNPYVAIEPYLLLNQIRIRKCRFYVGSEFELFGNELEVYLILESKFQDQAISVFHKVGIHYKF